MSWWNVAIAPIVAIMAMGCGRRFIFWSLAGIAFGFWALLALMFLPKRPVKEIIFPAFIQDFIKHRAIANWSKKLKVSDFA